MQNTTHSTNTPQKKDTFDPPAVLKKQNASRGRGDASDEPPALHGLRPLPSSKAVDQGKDGHNVPNLLARTAEKKGSHTFLRTLRSEKWEDYSYSKIRDDVLRLASGLWDLGVRRGDRIAIAAENSPEWIVCFLGILQIGAIAVPIDPKMTPREMDNLFAGSEPTLLFTSRATRPRVEEAAPGLHFGNRIFDLDPDSTPEKSWTSLWKTPDTAPVVTIRPDEPAVIIYTSGTTGNPKGVVITHENLATSAQATIAEVPLLETDRCLFVLPMFHIYCLSTMMSVIAAGCTLALQTQLKGPEILAALKTNRSTVLPVVPRLLELLQKGLLDKINNESPWTRRLFTFSFGISQNLSRIFGTRPGKILFSKIQEAFGGSLRTIISGGGRLAPETFHFFETLGFTIQEGYGLSETTGCISINRLDSRKPESVGKALSINHIKINSPGPDGIGEILVQGPTVFKGYYKNPQLNAECFTGEWFHTGDLGYLDSQDRLMITGRKKDIIVLSSGKNVYPDEIESAFALSPLVKQVSIIGLDRGHGEEVVAVVVPELSRFKDEDRTDRSRVIAVLKEDLAKISATMSSHKRPTRMEIFFEDLPTTLIGKIKRHEVKSLLKSKAMTSPHALEKTAESSPIANDPVALRAEAVLRKIMGDRAPAEINSATHLELDLGMDSLARTELVSSLESAFRITVPDEEIINIQTFGGVLTVLRRHTDTTLSHEHAESLEDIAALNDSIPERLDFSLHGQTSRLEWLKERTGVSLEHLPKSSLDPSLLKGNIEHFIGMAQVPVGIAGPLLIEGEHAQGSFYIPLATTEGALVASVTRGMMAITRSGGARAKVLDDQVMRAPVFIFERGRQVEEFSAWLEANFDRIKAAAETTTRSGRLKAIECLPNGRRLTVRFLYTSGDASGQNMVTMATHAACTWILKENPVSGLTDHFLENNLSGDKKLSMVNILSARGKKVYADAVIKKNVLKHFLHTTPERMVAFWREGALGSIQAGIPGTNAHYANILAAIFIATGQDVACTHEASTGLTVCDLTPSGDLYISITLPNLIIATVGGGTGKGTQKESLELMGCAGSGKVHRLAEIIAASVLAGEISIAGAHSAGDFAQAHDKLGRNRPKA